MCSCFAVMVSFIYTMSWVMALSHICIYSFMKSCFFSSSFFFRAGRVPLYCGVLVLRFLHFGLIKPRLQPVPYRIFCGFFDPVFSQRPAFRDPVFPVFPRSFDQGFLPFFNALYNRMPEPRFFEFLDTF